MDDSIDTYSATELKTEGEIIDYMFDNYALGTNEKVKDEKSYFDTFDDSCFCRDVVFLL